MGDFGESKSNSSIDSASAPKGNLRFRNPEFWEKETDQSKADIWSFGTMVLYLLLPEKISSKIQRPFFLMKED